jgi:transcriptional/translational regulatory protein YebC/TACO1
MVRMPLQRAIKRAVEGSQGDFKENVYEAYGHGGVGIIITALTDNVNRANADIKTMCNKKDLKMASSGSVAFQVALAQLCCKAVLM